MIAIMTTCTDIAWTQVTDTRVEGTLLMKPVTVGGLMVFQCRIWNMEEDYSFNIVRFYNDQIEPITSRNLYHDSPLQNRVFLSRRVFSDQTHVYVMTLVDISHNDEGEY